MPKQRLLRIRGILGLRVTGENVPGCIDQGKECAMGQVIMRCVGYELGCGHDGEQYVRHRTARPHDGIGFDQRRSAPRRSGGTVI